jgi:hypothetical protein
MKYVLKNDRFRRSRGGKAVVLRITCAKCKEMVLMYQKDGNGALMRCYLNRILDPPNLENLQYDSSIDQANKMPALRCPKCYEMIGVPMLHREGRLAFRLVPGSYHKRLVPN